MRRPYKPTYRRENGRVREMRSLVLAFLRWRHRDYDNAVVIKPKTHDANNEDNFISSMDLLKDFDIHSSDRAKISRIIGSSLRNYCIMQGVALRRRARGKSWLFPSAAATEWMDNFGRNMVADYLLHKAEEDGQIAFSFAAHQIQPGQSGPERPPDLGAMGPR